MVSFTHSSPWFNQAPFARNVVKSYHNTKGPSPSPINQWPIWNVKKQNPRDTEIFSDGCCLFENTNRRLLCLKNFFIFQGLEIFLTLAASCCFDFFSRTPPWNDQMTSASTSHSILGFIQVRGHKGVSMGSGPSSQGDLANSIISGFMFSGETGESWPLAQGSGWSTITIWKPGTHGGCWDQSWPWENAASQMPFFSQGSEFYRALVFFLLCTEPFFFFFFTWNDFFWPHTPFR